VPPRAAILAGALLVSALALASWLERAWIGHAGDDRLAAPSVGAAREAASPERSHGAPLAARRIAAARGGIEWLLGQREAMSPEWAYAVFLTLVPIAPDAALADACRERLDAAARTAFAALPERWSDPTLIEAATLRPIVAELLRRQRVGAPWRREALGLEALVQPRAAEFWGGLAPAQQAAFLYGFSALGIEAGRTLGDTASLLRLRWRTNDHARLLGHAPFVYGVTHVLYTASRYFERFPDPQTFDLERGILREALWHYLAAPPPKERIFLDLQAEILVGLRLLRTPEDDDMRAMSERLLALQSPDRSWGEESGNHRFHATGVAVQALLDYPEEFRRR
jgi:hypothetical protein